MLVEAAHFGDRHAQARLQSVLEGLDHATAILERSRAWDLEGQPEHPDEHALLLLEGRLDLFDIVRLDDVAVLDVVVALEADAALGAVLDLARVVLEALEAGELAGPYDDAVADEPHLGGALDAALDDHAAGDGADLADAERGADLCLAELLLHAPRRQQAFHRAAHIVDALVDDVVEADLHALLL